nr:guanylate kinase [candidate division Zixibacteria bacterium]
MKNIKVKGKIVIISSPSGGGKSSICQSLLKKNRRSGWKFSISYTTRPKRPNERDGREYFFVDHAEFMRLRDRGQFAEWCQVHRFYYGTPRQPLEEVLYNGGVMILDVDVKGARKLKKEYEKAVKIFILPPSRGELKRRLKQRGTEDDKHLKIRQRRALSEMKLYKQFEYTVINRDLETAVNEVDMIIKSLHCRRNNLDLEQIGRIIG